MVAQCYELSWPRRAMCFWAGRPSNLFDLVFFTSYFLTFRAANATWLYGKFLARHKAAFNLWHGDRVLTNMMSQADSSSSASVPSLKQRSKYLRIKFQLFQGWIFVKILKRIGNINFKHGIYPQFILEAAAVRLSSSDFHEMYRDRSPQYALWFTLCIQGRER